MDWPSLVTFSKLQLAASGQDGQFCGFRKRYQMFNDVYFKRKYNEAPHCPTLCGICLCGFLPSFVLSLQTK